ncbi:MAG: ABC transporter permease [Gammaproteobacteria bacterium]
MSTKASSRWSRLAAIDRVGLVFLCALCAIALMLLVLPSVIVVGISFTEKAYIGFPPAGFSFRWYTELLQHRQLMDSALTSLRIAGTTTIAALALGVPAAFALVRGRFPARAGATAFVVAPQMLPGMVLGIAILFTGAYFAFHQSMTMVVLAMTVFVLPFAVRMVMARLALLDPTLDEASTVLGANRSQTFLRVTLPQLTPAVIAAAAFVFIEAFDNITVALFTASPRARPLSVELYNLVQFDSSPIVASLSSLEILLAFIVLVVLARTVGLDRLRS